MSAIEVGVVRASASLETASFEAGTKNVRSALRTLEGGFKETSREALRSAEDMARAWDGSFKKTTSAMQDHIAALTGVDREGRNASASAKAWASQLDRQAKSFDRLRASIDPVFAASKQYEAAVEKTELAVRSGIVTQSEANRVLDQAAKRYLGVSGAANAASAPTRSFMGLFSKERSHDLRQIGLQLSQVGQQGSVTGNYLGAAAVQAADIGASFGLIGIAVGTAISVLGPFAVELLGGAEKAKTLDDRLRDLSESVSRIDEVSGIAKSSLSELRSQYGENAEAVRELYRELVTLNQQKALNAVDDAIREAADGLAEMEDAIAAFSEARREMLMLKDQIADNPFGPLPSEVKRLEEVVAQASAKMQEQFGLTSAQAYRIRDALVDVNSAATHEAAIEAARNLSLAIASAADEGSRLSPEFVTIANAAGAAFREAVKVEQEVRLSKNAAAALADEIGRGAVNALELANIDIASGVSAAAEEAAKLAASLGVSLNAAINIANMQSSLEYSGRGGDPRDFVETTYQQALGYKSVDEIIKELTKNTKKLGGASTSATKSSLASLKAELTQRQKLLGMTGDQRRKYEAMISIQQRLGKEAGKVGKVQLEFLADQLVHLDKAEESMQRVKDLQAQWSQEITRTAFEGGSLSDTIEGMLRDIAYQFAHAKVVLPVVASISGILGLDQLVLGGGGATQAAGASGGGNNLLGLLGGSANLMGGGGFVSGIGSGLGGVLSGGGLGSSFANLGGLVTGTSGFAGGALGAALPALGIIVGLGAALKSAFSRKFAFSALEGNVTTEGFNGWGRDFYKGGLFRSDKSVHSALDVGMSSALDDQTKALTGSLLDMSEALGLGRDTLADYEGYFVSVMTSGRSQQQIQDDLAKHFEIASDQMAEMILGTEELSKAGESATETLTRLATGLASFNDAMDLLGGPQLDASLLNADVAADLVENFGGVEAMTASVNTYFAAFYSETEKLETMRRRALEQLGEQFDDLGVALPKSRAGFRALVEGVDLTTEAGRELYAELLRLSGALDQVLPKVSAYTEAMQGIVDQIGGEIGVQIGAAQDMARISEQSAQLWYRTASTLRDFLSDLLNTDLTAASRSQTMAVNRSRFETAFDMARGGNVDAARDIPELAKAYLNSARANASTSLEYRRIAGQVQGQVNFLSGIAELEGANDDVLRGLYEQQIEVLTGLGQFLQLEGLTDEQVGQLSDGVQALAEDWDGTVEAFENSLGALEEAIKTAEAFSYDDLVGSLDVAVTLADNAPAWVQRLVDRADTGIRTSLDFIIRNNELSPDLRWLAVNSLSEHVKSLDFVLRQDVDGQTRRLALEAGSELRRNISFILMDDLTPDQTRIALAGNSELSRIVNVALGQADAKAVKLALANVGSYAVTVSGLFEEGGNRNLLRRMLGGSGSYSAMLDASLGQLKGNKRRILLEQQGDYLATIRAAIANDSLTGKARALLLNSETRAIRKLTIQATGLTGDNQALIDAIKGCDSLITLAGQFKFSPESAFKTWYSDRTKALISSPMGKLGDHLKDLRDEVRADRIQREVARLQAEGAAAASSYQMMSGQGIIDQILALEQRSGASLRNGNKDAVLEIGDNGLIKYQSTGVLNDGTNYLTAAAKAPWLESFWSDGGLEDQIFAYNRQRTQAQRDIAKLEKQLRDLGVIPAFANGGTHRGGLARVGENDIELVAPSRIYNPADTKAMLDNRDVVAELRELRKELAELRRDKHRTDFQKIREAKEITRIAQKQDAIGVKIQEEV